MAIKPFSFQDDAQEPLVEEFFGPFKPCWPFLVLTLDILRDIGVFTTSDTSSSTFYRFDPDSTRWVRTRPGVSIRLTPRQTIFLHALDVPQPPNWQSHYDLTLSPSRRRAHNIRTNFTAERAAVVNQHHSTILDSAAVKGKGRELPISSASTLQTLSKPRPRPRPKPRPVPCSTIAKAEPQSPTIKHEHKIQPFPSLSPLWNGGDDDILELSDFSRSISPTIHVPRGVGRRIQSPIEISDSEVGGSSEPPRSPIEPHAGESPFIPHPSPIVSRAASLALSYTDAEARPQSPAQTHHSQSPIQAHPSQSELPHHSQSVHRSQPPHGRLDRLWPKDWHAVDIVEGFRHCEEVSRRPFGSIEKEFTSIFGVPWVRSTF